MMDGLLGVCDEMGWRVSRIEFSVSSASQL